MIDTSGSTNANHGTFPAMTAEQWFRHGRAMLLFPPPRTTQPQCILALPQAWPDGVVAIDLDIVAHNLSRGEPGTWEAPRGYFGIPTLRIALTLSVPDNVTFGSTAGVAARPSDAQALSSCAVLSAALPWLRLRPCNSDARSGGRLDPDLRSVALQPLSTVLRDGGLGPDVFDAVASMNYHPFSTVPHNVATLLPTTASPLAWGAGIAAAPATEHRRVTVATVALETPQCSAPVHAGGSGLFFGTSPPSGASGALGSGMRARGAALLGSRHQPAWEPRGLHVTLTRASSGTPHTLIVAAAETALLRAGFAEINTRAHPEPSLGFARSRVLEVAQRAPDGCTIHAVADASNREGAESGTMTSYMRAALGACTTARAMRAHAAAAGLDLWLQPPHATVAAGWRARVCRSVANTGLHRDLEYRVSVASPMLARGVDVSKCTLVLSQRLESSMYMDLDEVRDQERGTGAYPPGAAGARLRAFAKFIDVEKPTSASTQHLVLLAHDATVRVEGSEEAALAALSGYRYGGVAATSSSEGSMVAFAGVFRELVHVRYQSPGCQHVPGEAASDVLSDTAGASRSHCATWPQLMSTYFGRVNADGTVYIQAGHQPHSSAPGSSGKAGGLIPPTSGCYGLAHLPLPSVHVSCSGLAGGAFIHVPVVNTALPTAAGYDADCTPPLVPVPVGYAEHFQLIRTVTAATTIAGSLLVVIVAWGASSRGREHTPREDQRHVSVSNAHASTYETALASSSAATVTAPSQREGGGTSLRRRL